MTVEELIAVLQQLPQEAQVWADGYPDTYPVTGVNVDWQGNAVIRRWHRIAGIC